MSRDEFKLKMASEKLALVHVYAKARVNAWTSVSGSTYSSPVSNFVSRVKYNGLYLTQGSSATITPSQFYYDHLSGILYVNLQDASDPDLGEVVVEFKLFFSNRAVVATHDLAATGAEVQYVGRLKTFPGSSSKVGINQSLISLTGQGKISLDNNDALLDEIFDTYVFDNQLVEIFSWSPDLNYTDAKLIYRGKISNKKYNSSTITFTYKDNINDIGQELPLNAYTTSDNVNKSIEGRYKRWAYGRVDGLQAQSIDQIGDGYTLTGTVAGSVSNTTLTGTGTIFLTECSPGDKITIETQEFTIESVESDTSLTLDDIPRYSFTLASAILLPKVSTVLKNRTFLLTDHACAQLTKVLNSVIQLNRIVLDNTDGLEPGDFLEFTTGERVEIRNVAPGNIVVLRQNLILIPTLFTSVIRQPVQNVFISGNKVNDDDFTITNNSSGCFITLDDDAEFNLSREKVLNNSLVFTNGTRTITTTDDVDLTQFLEPRDFIRPNDVLYSTLYEILDVQAQQITIRTSFSDPSITVTGLIKTPDYVDDDTIVSCNILGKTKNGEPAGEWIKTAPDVISDVLGEVNISNLNTTSFADSALRLDKTVSMMVPFTPSSSSVKAKDVIDRMCKSVNSALVLDNNLDLKFVIMDNFTPASPVKISDRDVINWDIEITSGKIFKTSVINYRHTDVLTSTLEAGSNTVQYSSDFVENYIETIKQLELDVYLYDDTQAQIMAERLVYYNRLSFAEVTVETDLRLEDLEIGDVVELDFERLYKRKGNAASNRKVVKITGKTVSGNRIKFVMSDLGNTFNTSAKIADASATEILTADEDEKLKNGYITDSNATINNSTDINNINLIS